MSIHKLAYYIYSPTILCILLVYVYSMCFAGEYGSMVSGQLNIVRTDVMGGSQSVAIKMLTGTCMNMHNSIVTRKICNRKDV